ncbi:MAG: DNA photolyase [Rhodobacteraceae bacterium]|nr:DNA photolyase [Paracoccaceae bacterium]
MTQLSLFDGPDDAPIWTADRAAGLARLQAWAGNAGRVYAGTRNYDFGPGQHRMVSALSPWLRHRLIEEREVLAAVLDRHSPQTAEKFVQEVIWRAYFKGWLENHPSVWESYCAERDALLRDMPPGLRAEVATAIAGETGIAPFDAWARELRDTGYLHNHARMWFASIWIFTLRLPWVLGADFFLRHLLDGDPASNTLSWRWVGGLHTRGKTYLARADNIARYTDGRFDPGDALATTAPPLTEDIIHPRRATPQGDTVPPGATRLGLLITEEDGHAETLGLARPPVSVLGLDAAAGRSPEPVSEAVAAFTRAAVAGATARAAAHHAVPVGTGEGADWAEAIGAWARADQLDGIVTAYLPQGPAACALRRAAQRLDLPVYQLLRPYDAACWPHATAGFFKLRKKIPDLLPRLLNG